MPIRNCFLPHDDFFMCDRGVRRFGGEGESDTHSSSIGGIALAFCRRWICV